MDIDRIISIIHTIKEDAIANTVGGGQIAGTAEAGDDPPVRRKKRRRTPNGRVGSRKMWLDFMRNM